MLLTLALRNLWRNTRRSLLTLSAMVVSSSLLILSLGVFSGMLRDMLVSATEQYHGHLVLSSAGYQEERDLFAHFEPAPALLAPLEQSPGIVAVSPRLRSFGLASRRQGTQPVELLGVDSRREREVTIFDRHLEAGQYLPATGLASDNSALIGRGLADKLGAEIGSELVFVTQAADGSIGNDLLRVVGIFATGDRRHDNGLVLVQLPWLQQLMVLPAQVHELAIRCREPMQAALLAKQLAPELPAGFELLDWGALLPEMREVIASYDISRLIMVAIIYFATALGILNTFFMSVLERTREFGILMALGMRPGQVRLLVLTETAAMGLLSLVFGLGLGWAMTFYMQQVGIDLSGWITPITYAGGTILPRLSAELQWANFLLPAFLLLLVCLLAGFLPANRAARLRPVAAIREE